MEFYQLVVNEIKKIVKDIFDGEIQEDMRLKEDLSFNSLRLLTLLTQMNLLANVDMFEASEKIADMITVKDTVMILDHYRK